MLATPFALALSVLIKSKQEILWRSQINTHHWWGRRDGNLKPRCPCVTHCSCLFYWYHPLTPCPHPITRVLRDSDSSRGEMSRSNYLLWSNAISFMSAIGSTSGRLHNEFLRLLFLQTHRETDRFLSSFRSSPCTIKQWTLPLPPRDVLLTAVQIESRQHPLQGGSFTY